MGRQTSIHQLSHCTADSRFAAESLASRLKNMFSWTEGVQVGEDIQAVHQMRVWSRRSREAHSLFSSIFQEKEYAALGRELTVVTRALGAARDLDVMILRIQTETKTLPTREQSGLLLFIARLTQQRIQKQRVLENVIKRLEKHQVQSRFEKFTACFTESITSEEGSEKAVNPTSSDHAILTSNNDNSLTPIKFLIFRTIASYLKKLNAADQVFQRPEEVKTLHQIRIIMKRFRYSLEILQDAPVLGDEEKKLFGDAITLIKSMQDDLGGLHDADVLCPILVAEARRLLRPGAITKRHPNLVGVHHADLEGALGLINLSEHVRDERDSYYLNIVEAWNQPLRERIFQSLKTLGEALKHCENSDTDNINDEKNSENC